MALVQKPSAVKSTSAFLYYESEERPKIEKLFPHYKTDQVTGEIKKNWKETNLETKREYMILAAQIAHGEQINKADLKLPSRLPISKYYNCLVLRNHQLLNDEFWTYGSVIINPEPHFYNEKVVPDFAIDCQGAIIAPGFIDVQINGAFGVDFSYDVDANKLSHAAKGLLAHGVTSFCPTLVSSFPDVYKKALQIIKPKAGGPHGAQILGVHVEGPFINEQKKGAHDPKTLIPGFEKGISSVIDVYEHLDSIAIITLAPELKNAMTVIKELEERGIVVSVGHSVAKIVQGEEAVTQGATFITHLFNAMLPFHHRDPGIVGLLGSNKIPQDKTIYYGLIADGIHTHPSTTRIAYRSYPKGVVLVTDAIAGLGLSDGTYQIGKQVVDVQGIRAYLTGTNTLAGSVSTMVHCIQHFWKVTSCTIVEALEAATLHPAKLLKIDNHKGTLDFGTDADFVLLSPGKLNVLSTWIAGECVYKSSANS